MAIAFDVDGTLILTGGAGARAMARAVEHDPSAARRMAALRFDGMTDRSIVRQALGGGGAGEEVIDHVLAHYLAHLPQELAARADRMRILPGVVAALDLCGAGGALVGLCTGNLAAGAEAKLSAAGLWSRFRFGGYGSDAEERAEIAGAAMARARALGASELVIVGDTPRDVEAARAVGARCVGVATGRFGVEELRAAGADLAVQDLARGLQDLRRILGLP